MERRFLKSAIDILALVFTSMGVFYTVTILIVGLSGIFEGDTWLVFFVFLAMGLLLLTAGVVFLVLRWRRSKRIQWLKEHGQKIMATFLETAPNYLVRFNTSPAVFVRCSYMLGQTQYIFKSYFVKDAVVPNLPQPSVPVYIDPNNIKNYYVDVNGMYGEQVVML